MSTETEKHKPIKSLTALLAIAFLALSMAILLIGGSFEIYFNYQAQKETIATKQQLIAQDAANLVAGYIDDKIKILEAAVQLSQPADMSPKEWKRVMASLLGIEAAFRQLVILDGEARETIVVSRLSRIASGKLADRAGDGFIPPMEAGERYLGAVYVDNATSEPLLIAAVPIRDVFGNPHGTLVAELNLKFMWDLVDRIKIGESGYAYVVDKKGNLIAFGDVGRVLRGENLSHLKEVGEFIRNPNTKDKTGAAVSIGIKGITIIGTYVPLLAPTWAVVSEMPVSEAYRDVFRSAIISGAAIVAMTLLAGILGVFLARRLTIPLHDLTATATRIAAGDMDLQAPVKGTAEVASLAGAFNRMTGQLRAMLRKEEERSNDLMREVAVRKAAEVALRESKERFELAMRGANDGLWDYNLDTDAVYFSPRWKEMLGYEPHEIGNTFDDWERMLHPEDRDKTLGKVNNYLGGHAETYECEFRMRHRDGHYVSILSRGFGVRDDEGTIRRMVGTHVDLTEHKNAQRELLRLRNLLANIINSMPSVLVGVDTEKRVTQWNREAETVTGVPVAAAIGRNLAEVFPLLESEAGHIRAAILSGIPQRDQRLARRIDGENRYWDLTVYPLVVNGIEGAVIRLDDVTERVHLEEMMIQTEKMMSVGGLAAGMAHEINNPLAGIIQNIQVLRNRMQKDLPRNIRAAEECGISMDVIAAYMEKRNLSDILGAAIESSHRAAQIVDNMLSFSRKSTSVKSSHDLSRLLDKTTEIAENDYDLKKNYDFRRIEIVREYEPDLPPVLCEASKIQQVFLNLLKNGAHAMTVAGGTGNGDETTKNPDARFILRVRRDGDMARVEIHDNGHGMDGVIRKRVFEPFFTTKKNGTGLGLSVSYFIITVDHNGTLAVESPPGGGTKFIIRLPFSGADAPEQV